MKTFEEYKLKDTFKKEFWTGTKKHADDPNVKVVEDELPPITILEIINARFGGLTNGGVGDRLVYFSQHLYGEFVDKKVKIDDKSFIVFNVKLTLDFEGNNNNLNVLFYKTVDSFINVDFKTPIIKIVKRKLTDEDPFGEEEWGND